MNQNEPFFLNLYMRDTEKLENFRSIDDLGNYVERIVK